MAAKRKSVQIDSSSDEELWYKKPKTKKPESQTMMQIESSDDEDEANNNVKPSLMAINGVNSQYGRWKLLIGVGSSDDDDEENLKPSLGAINAVNKQEGKWPKLIRIDVDSESDSPCDNKSESISIVDDEEEKEEPITIEDWSGAEELSKEIPRKPAAVKKSVTNSVGDTKLLFKNKEKKGIKKVVASKTIGGPIKKKGRKKICNALKPTMDGSKGKKSSNMSHIAPNDDGEEVIFVDEVKRKGVLAIYFTRNECIFDNEEW